MFFQYFSCYENVKIILIIHPLNHMTTQSAINQEFINTLAILIVNNLSVETWLLKIDDENMGRGIAYFNVNSLKYLR